ncbi:hypothetical protein VNI00_016360 [Paramarasmius palmivorus]|uniref:Uncharacterized protein n=1 Tax=Paramarasmius palmivorus TaxID=297713 RepID=A0AAW0BCY0_9AGAR
MDNDSSALFGVEGLELIKLPVKALTPPLSQQDEGVRSFNLSSDTSKRCTPEAKEEDSIYNIKATIQYHADEEKQDAHFGLR